MTSQTTSLGPWDATLPRDLRYGSVLVGNTPGEPPVYPPPPILLGMPGFWDMNTYSGSGDVLNQGTIGGAGNLQFSGGAVACMKEPVKYLQSRRGFAEFCQVPASALHNPTTSLDIRIAFNLDDYTAPVQQDCLGRASVTGNNRSWSLFLATTTGIPVMNLSTNGTASVPISATAALPFADGTIGALRAVWNVAGTVDFYTKVPSLASVAADVVSSSGWTQLGTQVTASVPTVALFNASTIPMFFGKSSATVTTTPGGKLYFGYAAVNGAIVETFDVNLANASAATWVSAQGNTVTIQRPLGCLPVVDRNQVLTDGINMNLTMAADENGFDVLATDSFSIGFVFRASVLFSGQPYFTKFDGANVGWRLRSTATANQSGFILGSSGVTVTRETAGLVPTEIRHIVAQRDVVADTVSIYYNGTQGPTTTDTTTGTSANATTARIASDTIIVTPLQFMGAYFTKTVLTPAELLEINTYFHTAP